MMNSTEMLNLVADIRNSAARLRNEQYANGLYSRSGGSVACRAFDDYAAILEKFAIDLVKKEAVEAALTQLPVGQTIIVKI